MSCLLNPHKPQYGGGIIINPEMNDGLKGWSAYGEAKIQHRQSQANQFIAAYSRYQPYDSISQKLYLQKDMLYTFSAWIQVSGGSNIQIRAVFNTSNGFKHVGATIAESGCWSMLKGGLTVDASGPAHLYFESKNTSVEIWADSVSLQPFTKNQWRAHQDQSIHKIGKRNVRIQAVDSQGNPLSNATISIQQNRLGFPFGCAINKNILTNTAYQNWFTSRFTVTTFEDEMKWYSTETSQGKVDYSVSDAMLQFVKQCNIAVRGHNVFWDDPKYQPSWINSLSRRQLALAAANRLFSIVPRYRGQLISWDVMNENLHFSYFERRIARNASKIFYKWAQQADGKTTLFMNDFNTIEDPNDYVSSPARYLQKLREIQSSAGNENGIQMGIGIEGHFSTSNLPYIRASLDILAAARLPIWITEVDVQSSPNQAMYLEQVLRETRSHPGVNGIVMWAAWRPEGCYSMCLTDNNFNNLKTGDVVDKLLHEWGWKGFIAGTTDANGFFETSLFHGDYHVKIKHPDMKNSSLDHILINVFPTTTGAKQTVPQQLQVLAT
ncbi:endo-1,4-beta-xylanase 5 [Ziziphus jujuba]|uniref:Endo-1,4-beta-xylanase 5 n=1 Tax=Ziziphus jujuba TaxID=326968 RepID=A0ABM3ZRS7_ZIZJJ|nr:endo-1,4-beta-xylanase 5 [Ziziphus jujuba]